MGLFFGTDGLRGKVNEDLTFEVAYKVGNALSILKDRPTVLIGGDTRVSRSYLTAGLAGGAMSGGAKVIDAGVVPTAGVAYLTRLTGADYGVVISASHNSGEYNGIKVFDKDGYKLGDREEERIERCFIHDKTNDFPYIGSYEQNFKLIKKYREFLLSAVRHPFKGKTIVLDCAFGAAHRVAPEVFRRAGASVIAANCVDDGLSINKNCGAVYPQNLARKVLRYKADMGFAFDGDADRVIAVDERGDVIDGDMILCALAKYFKQQGRLQGNAVVGTSHTNMAIEDNLKAQGIEMVRTDIGDKYVLAKMREKSYSLGGEQSGHIILKDYATTGDGILTAIAVTNMLLSENKTLSQGVKIALYPQVNRNVVVGDKFRVINNEELGRQVAKYAAVLSGKGRLMIRASGTEPKIRVMAESKDEALNRTIADDIVATIEKINREE
ncbi:MAG: phosphoglucosamine mutase [Candidatus Scatosoma sp.]